MSPIQNPKSKIENPKSFVVHTHKPTVPHLAAAPVKKAKLLPPRINDQRRLPRLGKKISLNEQIITRQKHAHARVRVLPADHLFTHEVCLDLPPQRRPAFVRERE